MGVSLIYLAYNFRVSTYVGISKNGAGPISKNPPDIKRQPIIVIYLGFMKGRSQSQPQAGADTAYTPPLMTNIKPSTIDENSN